nr:MAG TPA: hypothetical protein [Caudoviricetes sp.]
MSSAILKFLLKLGIIFRCLPTADKVKQKNRLESDTVYSDLQQFIAVFPASQDVGSPPNL